jgi:hypothetical protein
LLSAGKFLAPQYGENDLSAIQSALSQDVRIAIPESVEIASYLECVAPYREELSSIADSLIEDDKSSHSQSLTRLNARLGELHEQMQLLRRHKGYLTYRAVWGFVGANKALIGSLLLGSAFAASGNYLGCGASAVVPIATRVVNKYTKVSIPNEATRLASEIRHAVRPRLQRVVAKYLNIDLRAMQLYDISKELTGDFQTKRARGKSNGVAPRRRQNN